MEKNHELELIESLKQRLAEMYVNPNPIWNLERVQAYKRAMELGEELFGKFYNVSDIKEPLMIHSFSVARKSISFTDEELEKFKELVSLCDLFDIDYASSYKEIRLAFGFELTNYDFNEN